MREMILNHASLAPAGRGEALAWLTDVAAGMAELIRSGVVPSTLRMSRWPHEIGCPGGRSLAETYRELAQRGERDASVFLMRLSSKAPLRSDIEPSVEDRFLRCEEKALPQDDGAPLLLCAITDGIAVSLPSEPVWDHDRLTVDFQELLPDGSFGEGGETVDNVARSSHGGVIVQRHRERLPIPRDAAGLWKQREQLFPHLTCGPDVEQCVELHAGLLPTIVNRLKDLDAAAAAWHDGAAPPWTCKVTPESDKVMDNPKFREARRFRSGDGTRVLFEWHARFGNGGRIHLRFDASVRKVEIGYVGPHLPQPPRP